MELKKRRHETQWNHMSARETVPTPHIPWVVWLFLSEHLLETEPLFGHITRQSVCNELDERRRNGNYGEMIQ